LSENWFNGFKYFKTGNGLFMLADGFDDYDNFYVFLDVNTENM